MGLAGKTKAEKRAYLEMFMDSHIALLVCDLTSLASLTHLTSILAVFRQVNSHVDDALDVILLVNKAEPNMKSVRFDARIYCQRPIY